MELQPPYPTSALLKSSADLGWSTLSAELRSHGVSETPVVVPQQTEVCLAVLGNQDGLVTRIRAGQCEQTKPTTGTIWLTPIGVGRSINIMAPVPKVLHLYLPTALFSRLSDDFNLPKMPDQIRYVSGVRDELINQVGLSILSEMMNETATGRMFAEAASVALAARLVQKYCDSGSCTPIALASHQLDHARLSRVLAYIEERLAEDITVTDLAKVACLSVFHFTRAFAGARGVPPHRYVSRRRLESAKAMIATGRAPLCEIALACRFSSQSSFTRAFRRATGVTPAEYRRAMR